ncbi:MAG: RsmB/NOP family class I SAM-dependent RNA methyltransferase [Parachlamydiales bacterium]|nr:RsmB/NOP family class I SAM-dependent RNA methyltransferase [Parachlamydiales bacterium]
MRLPFCDHHICVILGLLTEKPLDLTLSNYFREHKSIGARDRRTIGETLYQMVRWKSLIDHFCPEGIPYQRLNAYKNLDRNAKGVPEHAKLGIPPFLFDRFTQAFGGEKAKDLCRILNTEAPTTIRVNLIKTTPELLMERWKEKFNLARCNDAGAGIQFKKREPLFALPEFKEGLFEVQDEGSQLVSDLIEAGPGDQVLDYCSGSGGKTLAFAHKMLGKGQIYLHDIRPWVLLEARKRLKRAGIQNAQFVLPKTPVDWLLADVPCSGTGTLRRNPDAKWKIDGEMVDRLILQQRQIVKDCLKYLKPGGRFVYATCSILPEENEMQARYFIENHQLVLEKQLSFLPEENGKDGFFAAVLKKQDLI